MFEVLLVHRQGTARHNRTVTLKSSLQLQQNAMLPFEAWQSSKVGRVSSSGKVGTPIHHHQSAKEIYKMALSRSAES